MSELFVPMGFHMLIEPDKPEGSSLIEAPETARKEKPSSGRIIAIGERVDSEVFPPGERVLFNPGALTRLSIDGKEHILITPDMVRAYLRDADIA